MRKKLIIAAVVFVIAIAGVAVYFYNSIDSIVQNAIEKTGSEITGTRVSVGSVDISLRSGKGTIRDVRVHNPEGFSDNDAVTLAEITLDLDVGSLNRDPILIEEVRIIAPVVSAEVDEKLVTNVGVIREHVQDYRAARAPASGKQDAGFEKHFTIRSFVMQEGAVHLDATRLGGEKREGVLPPVELANVGGDRGARPEALGKVISAAMFARVTQVARDQLTTSAAGKIKEKLGEILNR
jgi:hypothetical protein